MGLWSGVGVTAALNCSKIFEISLVPPYFMLACVIVYGVKEK